MAFKNFTRPIRILLQCSTPLHDVLSKRTLLKECGPTVNVTLTQARDKLRNIVGTPPGHEDHRDPAVVSLPLAASQAELPQRSMLDSYEEAVVPITKNALLKQKYINFFNHVRYGRIMEDLDTMAVSIAYNYVRGVDMPISQKSPLVIVTAFVDSMHVQKGTITPDQDVIIRGHVTWAGATSMEISLSVEQEKDGVHQRKLDAKFLMVARDPANKKKAYIPKLKVETPEEQKYFDAGEARKVNRQKESMDSLFSHPPNTEERVIIHNLFLNSLDKNAATFKARIKPENSVWMRDSKMKNIIIGFPEERNLYNKMFGGFLMRQGLELAWANAFVYGKARPVLRAVDDINFKQPVEIGSLLYLSSQVVYTKDTLMEMRVHAEVVNPTTSTRTTTNIFYFTFECADEKIVPSIIPTTYAEYMMYIDGSRHLERSITST